MKYHNDDFDHIISMLIHTPHTKFTRALESRPLEIPAEIKHAEDALKRNRGYVFRIPKPGSSVILLLSGGLDSVTCWAMLMKEFGLTVYPISFDRGEKRAVREEQSIAYFSSYFQTRYPSLYRDPVRLSFGANPITIPIERSLEQMHPDIIMENFRGDPKLLNINISFGSFLLLPIYAKMYAEFLTHTRNLPVNTIFCSVTAGDGMLLRHQTLTSLRMIMHLLCVTSGDWRWQFASAAFERETGMYYDKQDLVRWAHGQSIPLEKTWSCYHSKPFQCGGTDCQTCLVRVDAFKQARVRDKTDYYPISEQTPVFS